MMDQEAESSSTRKRHREEQHEEVQVAEVVKKPKLLSKQTPEERLLIVTQLREIENKLKDNAEEYIAKPKLLQEAIKSFTEIESRAAHVTDAIIGAQVLEKLSEVGRKQATNLNKEALMSIEDFSRCLSKTLIDGPESKAIRQPKKKSDAKGGGDDDEDDETIRSSAFDWARLGSHFGGFLRSVHVASFMNGPLSIQPKERKVAERSKQPKIKKPDAQFAEKPTDLKSLENEEQTATANRIDLLKKYLPRSVGQSINYWQFVLHPTSFTESIENVFDMAFLVRAGLVGIEFRGKEPYIVVKKTLQISSAEQQDSAPAGKSKQTVVQLDYQTWQKLAAHYKLTQAMIKRAAVKPAAAPAPARR